MKTTTSLPALLAVVLLTGMASAQETYKLTGFWYMNRGPLVDIPLNGVLIEPRMNGSAPRMILTYDQPPADPGCGGVSIANGVLPM